MSMYDRDWYREWRNSEPQNPVSDEFGEFAIEVRPKACIKRRAAITGRRIVNALVLATIFFVGMGTDRVVVLFSDSSTEKRKEAAPMSGDLRPTQLHMGDFAVLSTN